MSHVTIQKSCSISFYFDILFDAVKIDEKSRNIGEALKVKPLGVLGVIDELDWKIIVISLDDPKDSPVSGKAVKKHLLLLGLQETLSLVAVYAENALHGFMVIPKIGLIHWEKMLSHFGCLLRLQVRFAVPWEAESSNGRLC